MPNPIKFIKETKAELKHVNWPTRKETVRATILVIVVSLVVAYILGLFDLIFTEILGKIL